MNLSTQRAAETLRGRAASLNLELYTTKPSKRPALMELILKATRGGDWHLQRILGNRWAVHDFNTDDMGRPNLVRTMDDYCKITRDGARIWQVVAKDWEEPASIRLLSLYRDPFTEPEEVEEGQPEEYVQQDPHAFIAALRAKRGGVPSAEPPQSASCSI